MLLRNLLFAYQLLVPIKIALSFGVVGLGLFDLGLGRLILLLRRGQAGAGVFDLGLGGRDLARRADRAYGDAHASRFRRGPSVRVLRLGAIERHLVVLGIELHEDGARERPGMGLHLIRREAARDERERVRRDLGLERGEALGHVAGPAVGAHGDPQRDGHADRA